MVIALRLVTIGYIKNEHGPEFKTPYNLADILANIELKHLQPMVNKKKKKKLPERKNNAYFA